MLMRSDEDMFMEQDQVDHSVTNYSKILVSVQRSKRVRSSPIKFKPVSWRRDDQAPDTQVSSKAVIKDHHVSHAIW